MPSRKPETRDPGRPIDALLLEVVEKAIDGDWQALRFVYRLVDR